MNKTSRISSSERGFTIIEVMVAALILVIGVLAVTTMVNNANAVTDTTKAREGAVNLDRQLLELARTQQYSRLDNSNLTSLLQSAGVPDDDPAAGWQVRRRNILFTVKSFACIFDSAKDGARTTVADAGANYCPGSPTPVATGTAGADPAPDDFRRVEFTVTWTLPGQIPSCNGQTSGTQYSNNSVTTGLGHACVTESELIPNPTGGLGPDIQSVVFDPACCTIGTGTEAGVIEADSSNKLVITVTTTSPADQVLWRSDDSVSSGSATAVASDTTFKTWTFTYNFPTNPPLSDGPHTITIQAFLASVSGNPRPFVIALNRNIPPAPNTQFTDFNGAAMLPIGVNTRLSGSASGKTPIVEVNWNQVGDGDILGYTVYRPVAPVASFSPLDPIACPTGGSSTLTSSTTTSCADTNPGTIGTVGVPNPVNYYVVAFDNAWTSRPNPPTYSSVQAVTPDGYCPLLSSAISLPAVLSSVFGTTRPGCPSQVSTIDLTAAAQKGRPTFQGSDCITKTTSNGLPFLSWPGARATDYPANPSTTPVQFYRIYRNPVDPNKPTVAERYSRTGTTTYVDSAPLSASDTYVVTAVDSNWQESDPLVNVC